MEPTLTPQERHRTRRFFNLVAPAFWMIDRRLLPEYRSTLEALALPSSATVLDLATGTGTLIRAFSERGHRVAGIDFAERLLRRARRRLPTANLRLMDLVDLPALPERAYDVVAMAYLLHGLPLAARRFVLREATRIARGSVLVFDYAAPGSWFVRLIERIEGPHFGDFVSRTFDELAADAGLAVVWSCRTSSIGASWLCRPQQGWRSASIE